jgi:NADH-quinone oxidoreductase subunit J
VAGRVEDGVVSSVRMIGRVMFRDYTFAFEATSLLILVAMVGAILLARQETRS